MLQCVAGCRYCCNELSLTPVRAGVTEAKGCGVWGQQLQHWPPLHTSTVPSLQTQAWETTGPQAGASLRDSEHSSQSIPLHFLSICSGLFINNYCPAERQCPGWLGRGEVTFRTPPVGFS
uniref:Uncharacterized protein n=1 Tax=Knipowitschia caucasica TaxID=637954 RepID=A0AAV2JHW0_KNICA